MIRRSISDKIKELTGKFPVIVITGPRQSGKTTLVKELFSGLPYVSLEDLDVRQACEEDPRGFLRSHKQGVILDEVQHAPFLFSYIQTEVDTYPDKQIVLSGSQNFLLLEKVSQSLAGRVALFKLLPFSFEELTSAGIELKDMDTMLHTGFYPRLHDQGIHPNDYYPNYIQTYVERDVRTVLNVGDISSFGRFVKLCAGRIGSLLNISSLANDAGLSPNTAKSWLSVLEASYIVYRLQPYHRSFPKRLVKQPKLYFYDTGLASSLLGIRDSEQMSTHFLKGALFENYVLCELLKHDLNKGREARLYFWRDSKGKEIDCLREEGAHLLAIEMKSGQTYTQSYFSNLNYWNKLSGHETSLNYVVYGGDITRKLPQGKLLAWNDLKELGID